MLICPPPAAQARAAWRPGQPRPAAWLARCGVDLFLYRVLGLRVGLWTLDLDSRSVSMPELARARAITDLLRPRMTILVSFPLGEMMDSA